MFLSIIIPFYNDEKFLNECLDSCLDQDYPQEDFEIICIDDGSTDPTPELLRGYAERNANVKVYFNKHTRNGRTDGLKIAKGDYIWFVDHDDIVAPNAVSELKKLADSNLEYDRIIFPVYEFENEMTENEKEKMRLGQLKVNALYFGNNAAVWSSIYKHAFLVEQDILPRSKCIDEAAAFWGKEKFAVWCGDQVFNEEVEDKGARALVTKGRPLYHYRKHPGSELGRFDQKWVEFRRKLIYNRFLLELYLALSYKKKYEEEKEKTGAASPQAVSAVVVKLRSAMENLVSMPKSFWSEGIKVAEESHAFFRKRPPEYTFTFSQYAHTLPVLDRFRPRVYLKYFLYCKRGAYCYRLALLPWRIAHGSDFVRRMKRAAKRIVTQKS